jgi:hypothetical protein
MMEKGNRLLCARADSSASATNTLCLKSGITIAIAGESELVCIYLFLRAESESHRSSSRTFFNSDAELKSRKQYRLFHFCLAVNF